jgi:hypothetical protein
LVVCLTAGIITKLKCKTDDFRKRYDFVHVPNSMPPALKKPHYSETATYLVDVRRQADEVVLAHSSILVESSDMYVCMQIIAACKAIITQVNEKLQITKDVKLSPQRAHTLKLKEMRAKKEGAHKARKRRKVQYLLGFVETH